MKKIVSTWCHVANHGLTVEKIQECKNFMVKSWMKKTKPQMIALNKGFFSPPSSMSWLIPCCCSYWQVLNWRAACLASHSRLQLPRMHLLPGTSTGVVSPLQLPLHSVSSVASQWIMHTDDKQSLLVTFRPANASTVPHSGPYVPHYINYIWKIKSLKK